MTFGVFPTDTIFNPKTEIWRLRGNTISGGVSVGNVPQMARTDGGGLWSCEQTGIDLCTKEELLTASALDMQLEGGVSPIVVPCFSLPLRPVPAGVEWAVGIALADDAALRATTLNVIIGSGAPLRGGEPFSIVHPGKGKRLYRVHSVTGPAVLVDGVLRQQIKCRPPLREATTAGADLDFNTPGCLMRLVNPEGWLSPLDIAHQQTAQPVWVEHFGG